MAWTVILTVYGTDTTAGSLPFCDDLLIMKSIFGFSNNLSHAITSTSLITNLH